MDVTERPWNSKEFFLLQLLSKPDTKNNKDAFLLDQVKINIHLWQQNQSVPKGQKKLMVNFSYFMDVTIMDITSWQQ